MHATLAGMTITTHGILVSGGTGQVGRLLVTALLEVGASVRVLTRSPDSANLPRQVDVVAGSFDELPDGLFADVGAAFVFPAAGATRFVAAAAAAGVPRLVLLSSLAAARQFERDTGSASQLHHSEVEDAVRTSGAAWTILRPGTFANNLLSWAQPIRFTGGVSGPYPASAQAPIHEADVAAAAAAALTQDGHDGQTYPMTGPQALTRVAQLDTIGAALGRRLTFTENTPADFTAEMSRYGVPADIVAMLLAYWSDTVTEPDRVRSPEPLIGRPARTLSEWARDHVADFR